MKDPCPALEGRASMSQKSEWALSAWLSFAFFLGGGGRSLCSGRRIFTETEAWLLEICAASLFLFFGGGPSLSSGKRIFSETEEWVLGVFAASAFFFLFFGGGPAPGSEKLMRIFGGLLREGVGGGLNRPLRRPSSAVVCSSGFWLLASDKYRTCSNPSQSTRRRS